VVALPGKKKRGVADLPPGKHYFQVRSMDRNLERDPKTRGLEFGVAVAWYKESRLLVIGSAGLALALILRELPSTGTPGWCAAMRSGGKSRPAHPTIGTGKPGTVSQPEK